MKEYHIQSVATISELLFKKIADLCSKYHINRCQGEAGTGEIVTSLAELFAVGMVSSSRISSQNSFFSLVFVSDSFSFLLKIISL